MPPVMPACDSDVKCFNQGLYSEGGGYGSRTPEKSIHKNFWVFLFAEALNMCSLRMLL